MYTELTLTLALSVAASVNCSFPLMLKRQKNLQLFIFKLQSKALCAFGVKQAIKSMGIIACLPICVNHL